MAITQGQAAVGTAAVQLNSPQSMPGIVHITNQTTPTRCLLAVLMLRRQRVTAF
jgi:hypothetical protein